MKKIRLTAKLVSVALFLFVAPPVQAGTVNNQDMIHDMRVSFAKKVNEIRKAWGMGPLSYSDALQKKTDVHTIVIAYHKVLVPKGGMSVSTLGQVYDTALSQSSNNTMRGPNRAQTIQEEASSLFWRVDNGNLYNPKAKSMAVSFAFRPGEPVVVIAMACPLRMKL